MQAFDFMDLYNLLWTCCTPCRTCRSPQQKCGVWALRKSTHSCRGFLYVRRQLNGVPIVGEQVCRCYDAAKLADEAWTRPDDENTENTTDTAPVRRPPPSSRFRRRVLSSRWNVDGAVAWRIADIEDRRWNATWLIDVGWGARVRGCAWWGGRWTWSCTRSMSNNRQHPGRCDAASDDPTPSPVRSHTQQPTHCNSKRQTVTPRLVFEILPLLDV